MKEFRSFRVSRGLIFVQVAIFLAATLIPTASQTQSVVTPRQAHSKPLHTVVTAGQSRNAVHVKFVEGSLLALRNNTITASDGISYPGMEAVLGSYPLKTARRLFSEPEADLKAVKSALGAATGEELPDLSLWYRLEAAAGTNAEALINALNALPEVEIAFPAPLPAPPPSSKAGLAAPPPPPTPSFVADQGYLDAAPGGIDARYGWTKTGGTGKNTAIADVEYSFNATHEDLKSVTVIGGTQFLGYGNDHGTAVLGELIGINNDYGITGIAYDVTAKFSSPCFDAECNVYNPADAINTARLNTVSGDVILIEQQTNVCGISGTGDTGYGPLEWYADVFDAIRTATAAGRIVVEAAGNGNVNLDQAACLKNFDRRYRDSGAVIVGAGAPPNYAQKDRSRLYFSSYGSRVDVQGWGVNVVTTGYGDLYTGSGENQWYTGTFAGTSSASPMVAGAAALLSSIAKEMGSVVSPSWIRSTLAQTGSPQQGVKGFPASQKIGPRPNLKAAIGKLPRPAVTVSPASINFGYVKSGVPSATHTATVRNTGNAGSYLYLSSITITGTEAGEFSYDASGCSKPLASRESCPVKVILSSTSSGLKEGTLTIFTNDPKKTSGAIVSLRGKAMAPK